MTTTPLPLPGARVCLDCRAPLPADACDRFYCDRCGQDGGVPLAHCRVAWSDRSRYWAVVVLACPYCGRKHHHGGASGPRPDLGVRVAHCHTGGSYHLVETPVSVAARRAKLGPALPYGYCDCAVTISGYVDRCSGCRP